MARVSVIYEDIVFQGENFPFDLGLDSETDLTAYTCNLNVRLEDSPATALISRTVTTLTADNFSFVINLTPAETGALALGVYIVGVEIANNAIDFNREALIRLEVKQGWVHD